MPHRASPISGKSVAVDVDNVDVDGAERISLFENSRPLIHQRIDAAIDDFFRGDLPLWDSSLRAPLANQGALLGILTRTPVLVVQIPSPRRFLAKPPHF